MLFHVYRLRDPRNREIFYVGITNDLQRRFAQHMASIYQEPILNEEKAMRIADILAAGLQVIMETIESWETEEQAREREFYWIETYLQQGIPLTNRILGQSVRQNLVHTSPEKIEQVYIALYNRIMKKEKGFQEGYFLPHWQTLCKEYKISKEGLHEVCMMLYKNDDIIRPDTRNQWYIHFSDRKSKDQMKYKKPSQEEENRVYRAIADKILRQEEGYQPRYYLSGQVVSNVLSRLSAEGYISNDNGYWRINTPETRELIRNSPPSF